MKCKQCGTVYEGNFCPICGAKNQEEPVAPPQGTMPGGQPGQPLPPVMPPKKKKKSHAGTVILLVLLVAAIALAVFFVMKPSSKDRVKWSEIVLGDMLPEPPVNRGQVHTNSAQSLYVVLDEMKDGEYAAYVSACKEKGFTEDAVEDSNSYKACNEEGYCLDLIHVGEGMDLHLEEPVKMGSFEWPAGEAGKQLPAPKSSTGKFSYEHDDSFRLLVGETSKEDYADYVKACSDAGFTVDYSKDALYYRAYNAAGWHLSLSYEGNHTMEISISAPEGGTETTEEESTAAETTAAETTEETQQETKAPASGLRPEFQAAMDSYEAFIDEYVEFMQKYIASNGTDLTLLADYAEYLEKLSRWEDDFDKWEEEDLNNEELAYYLEVQSRVLKKLSEFAED